jgi:(p)ppGpp synthase/HD superfamily hydrolase
MDLVFKAARVAAHAHRNQYRKWPNAMGLLDPYITHPAKVASALMIGQDDLQRVMYGSFEDMVAAAWLHDVVEDTEITHFYLEQMFPRGVTDLVKGMTNVKVPGLSRDEQKAADRRRLSTQPAAVKVLKAYDRIINLEDLATAPRSFMQKYIPESEELLKVLRTYLPLPVVRRYEGLLNRYREASPPEQAGELRGEVARMV